MAPAFGGDWRVADRVEEDRIRRGVRRPPEIVTKTLQARAMDEGDLCRGCIERIRRGERIQVEEDLNCYSPARYRRTHTRCLPKNVDREVARFLRGRASSVAERRRSPESVVQ